MEPVNPISLENLAEACKRLCPEKTGYYATHFEELNNSVNWYGFAVVEQMKKKELISDMIAHLVDASEMETDEVCKLVREHRETANIQRRGYWIVYRLFFSGYTPYIEFKRCFQGDIHENRDVPPGYNSELVWIDSFRDEIDVSHREAYSIVGIGSGKEKQLGIDMNRMAGSFFEKIVWPLIRKKNQYPPTALETMESETDDYDEDYL
jgi:hypothetical protein